MESKKKTSTNITFGILGAAAVGLIGYGIKKLFFDDDNKQTNKGKEKEKKEEKKVENKEIKKVETTTTSDDIDEEEIAEEIKSFVCPITNTIMEDPVISPDGISYEKSAIEVWFNKHNTCLLTNKPLNKKDLIRNIELKNSITEYIKTQKKKK
jgi:hypothetical protein